MAPALPAQSARPLGQGVLDHALHTLAMPQGHAKRPFRPQTGHSRSHRPPLGVRFYHLKNPLNVCFFLAVLFIYLYIYLDKVDLKFIIENIAKVHKPNILCLIYMVTLCFQII